MKLTSDKVVIHSELFGIANFTVDVTLVPEDNMSTMNYIGEFMKRMEVQMKVNHEAFNENIKCSHEKLEKEIRDSKDEIKQEIMNIKTKINEVSEEAMRIKNEVIKN